MKIDHIDVYCVRIPLKPERRMISALGRHDESCFVLIRVCTDDGRSGVGEATVTPRWSGETVWGAAALIKRVLAPVVEGCDPNDIPAISERMDTVTVGNWFAKSAIEMACWDLAGQAAEKPVYELLGGAVRDLTIRNRFSLGAYEPKIAAERAAALVQAGFTTIKVKVGTGPTEDIQRVRAVREAIGSDVQLTIDANAGWTFADAQQCLREIADCDPAFVEQPLERGDYHQTRRLREQLGIRILADESCFDPVQLRELILHECCDAVTLYPGKQGGILRAKQMAEQAAEHDLPCTIGSNLEWDVGAAAMMHFVVATQNVQIETIPGDCLGPSYHEFSVAHHPLKIEGPFTTLPDRPGLGIDVNWDLVQQHLLPGTGLL
ncbi:MAG: dipeptide epimerase [Fuerstiella sp.]